jgi:hypothetical protein
VLAAHAREHIRLLFRRLLIPQHMATSQGSTKAVASDAVRSWRYYSICPFSSPTLFHTPLLFLNSIPYAPQQVAIHRDLEAQTVSDWKTTNIMARRLRVSKMSSRYPSTIDWVSELLKRMLSSAPYNTVSFNPPPPPHTHYYQVYSGSLQAMNCSASTTRREG